MVFPGKAYLLNETYLIRTNKIHSGHTPLYVGGEGGWASNQVFKKGAWQDFNF